MKIVTELELDHEELIDLQTSVIIEGWDKRKFGRGKRMWLSEFTQEERDAAWHLHEKFFRWAMLDGIPQRHRFRTVTSLELVQKLVSFFARI